MINEEILAFTSERIGALLTNCSFKYFDKLWKLKTVSNLFDKVTYINVYLTAWKRHAF